MRVLALLLLLVLGLPLTIGGAYLIALGGSGFYLISGLLVLTVAYGFMQRVRWALPLYAVWLSALLAWALWEVGLHWWPLATRVGLPAIIGFVLAAYAASTSAEEEGGDQPLVWPVLSTSILAAVVALLGVPHHLQETKGVLAMEVLNPSPKLGDQPFAVGIIWLSPPRQP